MINVNDGNWDIKYISDLGTIYSGSTPSTNNHNFWNGDIVWITPNDLSEIRSRFIHSSERKITIAGLKSCSTKLLPANSLVISSRAPIGYLALPTTDFCTNQGCKSIVFNLEQDPEFHYYNLLFRVKLIKEKGEGTTFSEISKSALSKIKILVPLSKSTQSKIAEVLSKIDKAIAQTETLIAKYKRVKTGLMQDLLTRGIDENGQLRDLTTHKFKRSPLGIIPDEWEVVTLANEIDIVHGHGFKGEYFSDQPPGKILLVPGNFHREGGIYFDNRNTKFYQGLIPEWTILNNGDILIVMTDLSPQTLILGRVIQIDLPFKVLHNQRIGKIIIKSPETWRNRFLMIVMNSTRFRNEIINNATGTTVKHTSPDRILINIVPKPSTTEQKQILTILDKQEQLISSEKNKLRKLQKIKTGLMQDLLTGKISVKPLLKNEP
jgi:type I restriction enzyme S subunit